MLILLLINDTANSWIILDLQAVLVRFRSANGLVSLAKSSGTLILSEVEHVINLVSAVEAPEIRMVWLIFGLNTQDG